MNAQRNWLQARAAYGRNPTAANRARAFQAWNAFRAGGLRNETAQILQAGEMASPGLRGCHLTAGEMAGFDDPANVTVGPTQRAYWGCQRRKRSGLAGPIDAILSSLGLLDVVAQEYPGAALADAYRMEKEKIDEHKRILSGLRSETARATLARDITSISNDMNSLAGAFSFPDSQIGKREKDMLVSVILRHRSYTKEWRDAKAKFGYADPQTGVVEGGPAAPAPAPAAAAPIFVQVPVATPADIPWGMIGLGVLAAAGLGMAIGGRRR